MAVKLYLAVLLLLSGCTTTRVIDIQRARLMPESISRQIVEKNIGSGWLKQPYLWKEALCGGDKVEITLDKIDSARYFASQERLVLVASRNQIPGLCIHEINIKVSSAGAARETVSALHSLGATANQLIETSNPLLK